MSKNRKSITMPLRLDEEQVEKLDIIATQQCNTRAGIIRLAVAMLIKSLPEEDAEQTEEAAA